MLHCHTIAMTEFGDNGPPGGCTPEEDALASREVADEIPPTMAVVTAVAQARGVAPTDLPALNEAVDIDALDALVRSESGAALLVGFEFAGHEVQVTGDGVVRVLA